MKWTFFAGLAALLAAAPPVSAQCAGGACGANVIPSAAGSQYGYPAYLGCGGFCFRFLGRMHQEGPLYNYGPYSGYYPFAPYGPWDSNLCYNDPNGAGCGGNGCGRGGAGNRCGWNRDLFGRHGLGGGFGNCAGGNCAGGGLGGRLAGIGGHFGGIGSHLGGGNCGSGGCGDYAVTTFKGVFHRSHPLSNRAKISTGSSAAPVSGCGDCAGSVSAVAATSVQPVSAESPADPVYGIRIYRER